MENEVSIAWWNTSISPARDRNRTVGDQLIAALLVIVDLLDKYAVDILCLGEVSPDDIIKLNELFKGTDYLIYDGAFNEGRIKHDISVIFNKNKFQLIDARSITEQTYLGSIRAGQELQIRHINTGQDFYIYVTHWPSRNHDCSDGMPKRYELGKTLRDAITRCSKVKGGEYFILIGDFNDEPFDHSITYGLGSSRDRDMVIKKDTLLYNPFWRHMGSKICFPELGHNESPAGTCFYKAGSISKWTTFDQIIFSSPFLKGDKWMLREDSVKVISDVELLALIKSSSTNFDHFPVFATIERI
ncbi:endonuclease/exonuclease/phosphatase family protein [Hafnia paralvei]|uniref:endonuclease/exonuclease/phosphatase family protein n=1 Tax=Hafnia paralvei TaxID=546367 RepID=UPI00241E967A|nr:endonuclease/exonuclease/phosphatase family protein [Hafnia paralvei]